MITNIKQSIIDRYLRQDMNSMTIDRIDLVYSDYLVGSVPAIAHIIRYGVFVTLLQP